MAQLEVETKVKLDLREIDSLRKRILKIANFKKKKSKSDDYFAIPLRRIGMIRKYPKKAFRIRDDGDSYVINFKKWLKKYWTKYVVIKEEFEFETKSPDKFLALMRDLGFREWVKKFKKSEVYEYKENKKVGIEINKVKHLGYFMEIEYIAEKRERKKAVRTIMRILEDLKIDLRDIDNTGYTRMLWNKGIRDRRYFLD
jgi:adenylate cyclase, class 2